MRIYRGTLLNATAFNQDYLELSINFSTPEVYEQLKDFASAKTRPIFCPVREVLNPATTSQAAFVIQTKLADHKAIITFTLEPTNDTIRSVESLTFVPKNGKVSDPVVEKKNPTVTNPKSNPFGSKKGQETPEEFTRPSKPDLVKTLEEMGVERRKYGPEKPEPTSARKEENLAPKPSNTVATVPPGPAPWPKKEKTSAFTPIDPDFLPYFHGGWRFGHTVINTKPEVVRYRRNSFVQESASLRMSDTFKSATGYSYETFSMSLKMNGAKAVYNDIKGILEQLLIQPFHTVEGGPFDKDIPYDAVAVTNYMLSTVPGEPESLNLTLNFDPFMWDYWSDQSFKEDGGQTEKSNYDTTTLSDKICFPLLEMWTKTRNKSEYNPTGPKAFNGTLMLELPSLEASHNISGLITNKPDTGFSNDNVSFDTIEALEGNNKTPTSLNVRQLENNGSLDSLYAIKIDSSDLFEDIVRAEVKPEWYLGLIEWSKVNLGLLSDVYGNIVPSSYIVKSYNLPDKGTQTSSDVYTNILDIRRAGNMDTQISAFYTAKKLAEIQADGGDESEAEARAKSLVEAAQKFPNNYFALVVKINSKNIQSFNDFVRNPKYNQYNAINVNNQFIDSLDEIFDDQDSVDTINSIYTKSGTSLDNPDIIIEGITGVGGHKVSTVHVNVMPLPVHQYNGGEGKVFTVEGTCFGTQARDQLKAFKEEFDRRALSRYDQSYRDTGNNNEADFKKSKTPSVFVRATGELFQLMGVNFVMPVSLEITSVPGNPEAWKFTLSLIDFNPLTQLAEKVKFLETANQKQLRTLKYNDAIAGPDDRHPLILKVQDELSLNTLIAQEELYPDLNLPTNSELKTWIGAFRDYAKAYATGEELPSYGPIFDEVAQKYIGFNKPQDNIARIANWAEDEYLNEDYGTGYADPDFYVFYHAHDSFHNTLENVMNSFVGEKNSVLSSSGKTAGSEEIIPILRLKDQRYGYETLATPTTFSNNDKDITRLFEDQKELITINGDFEEGQNLLEAEKESAANLKAEGGKLGWWVADIFSKPQDNISLVTLSNIGNRDLNPNDVMPIGTASKDPNEQEQALADFKKEIDTAGTEFKKFLTYQERYKLLLYALRATVDPVPPFGNIKGKTGFVINTDQRSEVQIFRNIDSPEKQISVNGQKVDTLDKWYKISLGQVRGNSYTDTSNQPGGNSQTFGDLNNNPSFISRTIITNNLWRKATPDSKLKFTQAKVLSDAIVKNTDYFNGVGKKYNLDPHIIKAWFIYRTNLGINKPLNSGGVGFGNISNRYIVNNGIDDTPESHIDLVSKVISKHYNRYRDYTLALVATDLELTTDGDSLNEQALKGIYEKLDEIALKLGQNPNNKTIKADLISQATLLTKVPGKFNQYYRVWLHLARTLGPYNIKTNNRHELYYTYQNPELLTDSILDDQNEQVRNGFISSFTPAGGTIIYEDTRGIDNISAEMFNEKVNNELSAETRAQLAYKMKSARSPDNQTAIWGMLHDFRKYSPYGKLRGAYPCYFILLINEGFYWRGGSEKLWDQYYTRTAINSIEVVRSRDEPGSVATIEFSNVFSWLTRYTAQKALFERMTREERERALRDLKHPIEWLSKLYSREVLKELDEDLLKVWQQNHLNFLMLGAGARLQIRMGYGSRPTDLPIIFNGTVMEVPTTETSVQVIALGDGHELKKPSVNKLERTESGYAYQNTGGFMGIAKSPANILVESLINKEGFNSVLSKLSGGRMWRDFSHGIAHFGDTYESGLYHYPAEVQINIYDSSSTSLEQSIPGYANFFNTHAAWDWDNSKTWFSVSVSEPNPWRVLQVCSNAVLDFVGSADYFGTRSSVFYGKWWWPYNYTYNSSILDLEEQEPYTGIRSKDNALLQKFIAFIEDGTIASISRDVNFEDIPIELQGEVKLKFPSKITNVQGGGDGVGWDIERVTETTKSKTDENGDIINYIKYHIKAAPKFKLGPVTRILQGPVGIPLLEGANKVLEGHQELKENTYTVERINYQGSNYVVPSLDKKTGEYVYNPLSNRFAAPTLAKSNSVEYIAANCNWKPFTQVYFANSLFNLIGCNIKADATQVATDAIGLHTYNSVLGKSGIYKNSTWCIDDDIQPAQRKTVQVNTGIMLNAFQGSFSNFFRGLTTNTIGRVAEIFVPGFNDQINKVPPSPAVENGVISGLLDTVKRMYQGHITMIGTPSIKPLDIIFLDDYKTGLRGPVKVRSVVHRFDPQTGMVSIISPDAVVLPQNSIQGANIITSLQTVGSQMMNFYAMRKASLAAWNTFRYISQPNVFSKASQAKMLRGAYIKEHYGDLLLNASRFNTGDDFVGPRIDTQLSAKLKTLIETDSQTLEDIADLLGLDKTEVETLKVLSDDFTDRERVSEWLKEKLGDAKFTNKNEIIARVEKARLERLSDLFDDPDALDELKRLGIQPKRSALRDALVSQIAEIESKLGGVTNVDDLTGSAKDYYLKNKQLINELAEELKKVDANPLYVPPLDFFETLVTKLRGDQLKSLYNGGLKEYAKLAKFKLGQVFTKTFQWETGVVKEFYSSVIKGRGFRKLGDRIAKPFLEANEEAALAAKVADEVKDATAAVETAEDLTGSKTAAAASKAVEKLGEVVGDAAGRLKNGGKAIADAVKEKEVISSTMRGFRSARTGIRLGMLAGPQIVIGLAKEVIMLSLGNSLIDSGNHYLSSRQCAKIIPLFVDGIPWVAGINGHAGAVIGDMPSWFDNAISNFTRTGSINGDSSDFGSAVALFGLTFVGIKPVNNSPSPMDIEYRKKAEEVPPNE